MSHMVVKKINDIYCITCFYLYNGRPTVVYVYGTYNSRSGFDYPSWYMDKSAGCEKPSCTIFQSWHLDGVGVGGLEKKPQLRSGSDAP